MAEPQKGQYTLGRGTLYLYREDIFEEVELGSVKDFKLDTGPKPDQKWIPNPSLSKSVSFSGTMDSKESQKMYKFWTKERNKNNYNRKIKRIRQRGKLK